MESLAKLTSSAFFDFKHDFSIGLVVQVTHANDNWQRTAATAPIWNALKSQFFIIDAMTKKDFCLPTILSFAKLYEITMQNRAATQTCAIAMKLLTHFSKSTKIDKN